MNWWKRVKKFEKDQRKALKKFMDEQSEPIRKRIKILHGERKGIDRELAKLGKALGRVIGGKDEPAPAAPKKKSGRRPHRTPEQKLELAGAVYRTLKSKKGQRHKTSELKPDAGGVEVKELVALWNDSNKDKKISNAGNKNASRYWVE